MSLLLNAAQLNTSLLRALMDFITEFTTAMSCVILSVSSLHAAYLLFKDHRASSVGFLLIGFSSVLSVFSPSNQTIKSLTNDLEWAGESLGPALITFDFLWLSEDYITARILLIGSTFFIMLSDWLSSDGLVIMSRCLAFSTLSCSLTVCAFAENAAGAVGSVALSLPLLVSPRTRSGSLGSLVMPTEGLLRWILKVIMALGCWTTGKALNKYLFDLKGWD
ncbi:uncharacterized protein LOC107685618 [Sinocyclocheilus anshuiensis]|uniref:uncharacterized protein LOC107685557 n=1 Tax=Sinocyclocheilus anshuiensis TaxID=1608454 RepID=UPI0007B869A9|nr:PREDICTED: uncharacterized protein LOC107685557 [Sinocyclocheilus anshuiensis]XP_016337754.1 PREDICTED: uncharacterized protein LOC107685618 [Sinocyclocheilus anshuiensis]